MGKDYTNVVNYYKMGEILVYKVVKKPNMTLVYQLKNRKWVPCGETLVNFAMEKRYVKLSEEEAFLVEI